MAAEATSFGLLVRRHRLALGLTQEELAERATLSPRVISEIERGGPHTPRRDTVALLVASLGLSAEERTALEALARPRPSAMAAPQATGGPQAGALALALTPLIGREREITALLQLLGSSQTRLLTLTGPGGVGKTRLAQHVAADLQARGGFEQGVCFVALAALSDPSLVATTVAGTLGVPEAAGRSPADVLSTYLRDKHVLLVLDNFEHLLPAAPLLSTLLAAAPGLSVLVTSRTVLRLTGEQECAVPPLAVPDLQRLPPLAALAVSPAVALFTQRAQLGVPSFTLDDASAPAVAEICVRLDGLPLALELAAARLKLFPLQALLARLSSRLTVLTGGARDLPVRQQTLRSTIEWSYHLLAAEEQSLFAGLGVFAGGWTLEAVEAVCSAPGAPPGAVLDQLGQLVESSLVRHEAVARTAGEPRLGMLETIHEYARERLEHSGARGAVQQAHAAYYLALVERAEVGLQGPEQARWFATLDPELPNLRVAADYFERQGAVEDALRLLAAQWPLWIGRGAEEWGRRLEALLVAPEVAARTVVRAKALWVAGTQADGFGYYQRAGTLYAESLTIARERGDRHWHARALQGMGSAAARLGDFAMAHASLEKSQALFREEGDAFALAWSLTLLGRLACRQGDTGAARRHFEESLRLRHTLGDRLGLGISLAGLAEVVHAQGDLAAAGALYEEALAIASDLDANGSRAGLLAALGDVALDTAEFAVARARYRESLLLFRGMGATKAIIDRLYCFASLAAAQAQPARALRLAGAADAHYARLGEPVAGSAYARWEHRRESARQALSAAQETAAWSDGHAMSIQLAMEYALEESGPA